MKRVTLSVLLLLLPLFSMGLHVAGSDSLTVSMVRCREYTEDQPLIYEDYSDLPPYSYIDEYGEKTGYNVELVKELLESLDIPYKIVLKHVSDAYYDLRNGQADLILSIYSKKRMGDGIYGNVPISVFTTSLLTPKSKPLKIQRVRELGDNKVLVHTGSLAYDVMRERDMGDNALPVTDMTQAIMRIAAQDSGMVVWNTMSMKYIIQTWNLSNLMLTPIHDLHSDLRFISHDTLLLAKLDSVYLVRQSDTELLDLRRKWFYPETEVKDYSYLWGVLGGVVFMGVIAMAIYFWFRQREHRKLEEFKRKNLQLSLYLKTGGISMWTYKVLRKQFCGLDAYGEEESAQEPSVFGAKYHPDDFAATLVAIEQIASGEKDSHHSTVRMLGRNGVYLYHNLQLTVLERDGHKHPRVILGMQSNTTEQRQKHLEHQATTLKFHTAFNVSNAWLLSFDSKGWLTNINPTACATFGVDDPDALIREGFKLEGLPFDFSYTGFDEGKEVWMSAQTDFDKHRAEGRFSHHITVRGQVFHELIVVPVVNSQGKLLATYVAGIDITDSVETARESHERKREIEYLYQRSRLGMDNLSHSLAFAQVRMGIYTPAMRSLSFADKGAMSNLSPLRLMVIVAQEDRLHLVNIFNRLDQCLMRRYNLQCRTRLRVPGGEGKRVFDVSIMPVAGEGGKADHYIVLTRDVSEVVHLQEQLAKETAKAQEAEQIKNAFLSNMSGEIRRPLNRMLQSATTLSRLSANGGDNDAANALSDDIHQTCRNLLTLVGDILTLSKIEAGLETMSIETVDMAVLFPAICQMSSSAIDQSLVKVKIEGQYDSLNIDTDTSFITRIIDGLFRCALSTTQRGSIKAAYEYFNGQLVIRVDDTGNGLTPAQIAAVNSHRFSGEDQGYNLLIKLAIVRELARSLNGQLDIESAPGHGTTVWVTLPCVLHDFKLHTTDDNETA